MRQMLLLWLGAVAQLGCSTAAVSTVSGSTTLSSATISAESLDDGQIESIARKVEVDQRTLGELAREQAGDPAVRRLGRRFAEDHSVPAVALVAFSPHPSAVEDAVADRDVAAELRLARYGGRSFDAVFFAEDTAMLDDDVTLVSRVLLPRATRPELKESLARLAALLVNEREALRALMAPEDAR